MKIPANTVNHLSTAQRSTINSELPQNNQDSEVLKKLAQGEKEWQQVQKDAPSISISTREDYLAWEKEFRDKATHFFERPKRAADAYTKMERGLQEVIAQISLEHPEILAKDFDLTRTMDGMEVVDHDLTEAEYNYVKHLANKNDDLLEGSDTLNQEVAEEKTTLWYQAQDRANKGPIYVKEDIAGRINIMEFKDKLIKHVWDLGGGTVEQKNSSFEYNYQNRANFSMGKELMDSISATINTKA